MEDASNDVAGWERYPHNLSFPVLEVDAGRYCERLKEDAERLFTPPEQSSELQMLDLTFQNGWYLLPQVATAPRWICHDLGMTVPF